MGEWVHCAAGARVHDVAHFQAGVCMCVFVCVCACACMCRNIKM